MRHSSHMNSPLLFTLLRHKLIDKEAPVRKDAASKKKKKVWCSKVLFLILQRLWYAIDLGSIFLSDGEVIALHLL